MKNLHYKMFWGFSLIATLMLTVFVLILYYTVNHNRQLINECQALGRTHFDCEMSIRHSYQHNYFNNGIYTGE